MYSLYKLVEFVFCPVTVSDQPTLVVDGPCAGTRLELVNVLERTEKLEQGIILSLVSSRFRHAVFLSLLLTLFVRDKVRNCATTPAIFFRRCSCRKSINRKREQN